MRILLFWGLLLASLTAQAQLVISGRLLDERQQPVPYASVALAGNQAGTVSNEAGEFELRVATLPQQLSVSGVGYEPAALSVLQAGALPTPLVLRAAAGPPPAGPAEQNAAAAEALVRRCYAKLLRHQADVAYGRGFYRQKTQQKGRYHEFFDAFYDVKITPRNLPSWVLGEGRYALLPDKFTLSNFSVYTRLLPVFAGPGSPTTATPLNPTSAEQFQLVLRTTQRTSGRELAVIDFAPRRPDDNLVRGTLYIEVGTAALWRIERDMPTGGLYIADTPELRIERYALRVTNTFAPQPGDSLTRLASTQAVATVQLIAKGVKQQSVTSSQFFIYQYGPPTPGEKYREAKELEKDVAALRKRRYQPLYWRTNAVLKNTPAEERALRDFETRQTFGKPE